MQPTLEQLKVIARSTTAYIDPNQINLFELLKSKFPGKDVENDPEAREQYLYYLKVCGGYYADKNAANMDQLAEKNARQQQRVIERLWQTLRVRQMANNDNGSTGDDSDSDAESLSADHDVLEGSLVVDDNPESIESIGSPDSHDDNANEPSMLPDSEPIQSQMESTPDVLTLSDNGGLELTDNNDQLLVVSEEMDPSLVGTPLESEPYIDDMVPAATSTQTQQ